MLKVRHSLVATLDSCRSVDVENHFQTAERKQLKTLNSASSKRYLVAQIIITILTVSDVVR